MKAWLSSVFAITLFTVLLNLLLKKTRLHKTIQGVLSVLLSLTFVQPILLLKEENNFVLLEWEGETIGVLGEIEEIVQQTKISYTQNKICEKLHQNGVIADVKVYGEFNEEIKIEKVLVKLNLSSISTQKMNIVEIRRTVSAYCEVDEEDVTIYAK